VSDRRIVSISHDWDVDLFTYIEPASRIFGDVRVEVDSETFARWGRITDEYWALQEELEALHKAGPTPISDPVEALRLAPVRP